jgi:ABC-type nitrate/sulfonate/bicarbonate transport system substrate-binding protein
MKSGSSPLAACVLAAAGLTLAGAAAAQTVQVNSFPSAANLPLWVGQREAMFQHEGLEVALSHPAGSVEQIKGLMDGKYQILVTALDNVVAYRDGHGAVDFGGPTDIVAFFGMDSGFLSLIGAPGTKSIADLKGKVMAVDALTTGYSFALQELLARAGLAKDSVSYIAVGSSGERWKALQAGKAQAALLNMPIDFEAMDKGYVRLGTVAGTLGHYQATVAAARQDWAEAHRATIIAFIRGYAEAVRWLATPEHRDQSIAILHAEMPNLDPSKLGRIYALLVDPREGISSDLAIDPEGAAMVLSLRARYGGPSGPVQDWRHYVDLSYLEAATP